MTHTQVEPVMSNVRNLKSPQPAQHGMSLIEVLITVVVLAVGLLGIAALQLMSKKSNFEAVQRTTATLLANGMIERMRNNAAKLTLYAGDASTPPAPLVFDSPLTAPAKDCAASGVVCSPDELVEHDLYQWQQLVIGASEKADGTGANTGGLTDPIACLSTTVSSAAANRSGEYSVAIAWRGSADLGDPYPAAAASDPQACGRDTGAAGTGPYDGPAPGNKNVYRRVLVLTTYIAAK